MSVDPMALVQAARPQMPEVGAPGAGTSLRRVRTSEAVINGRSIDELATVPGSPAYRAKIPPPACALCAEDHVPGASYDHAYQAEPTSVSVAVPAVVPTNSGTAPAVGLPPQQMTAGTLPAQRVAVYVGRGDDQFVLAVETAPDWDTTDSWKLDGATTLQVLNVVRSLGVKVSDKTGGDLACLAI